MKVEVDRLALLLQADYPYTYCFSCLAPRMGMAQTAVRDTAQVLILRDHQLFAVRRRVCIGCRAVGDLLVYRKPGS